MLLPSQNTATSTKNMVCPGIIYIAHDRLSIVTHSAMYNDSDNELLGNWYWLTWLFHMSDILCDENTNRGFVLDKTCRQYGWLVEWFDTFFRLLDYVPIPLNVQYIRWNTVQNLFWRDFGNGHFIHTLHGFFIVAGKILIFLQRQQANETDYRTSPWTLLIATTKRITL